MHPFGRKNPCLVALKYTLRVRRSGKKAWYKVRYIKALRNINGAREWLIAWDGEDDDGNAWPDSWEPTKNVSEDLREMYSSIITDGKDCNLLYSQYQFR